MAYILEATLLAAGVGAYRIYTDRRRSLIHTNWDAYRHLLLGSGRRAGDFMASLCYDLTCSYPEEARLWYAKARETPLLMSADWDRVRSRILFRASRYRVWENCSNLSYLQRLGHANPDTTDTSIFAARQSWRKDVTFSSPSALQHVKDDATKKYLNELSIVRDGYVGILEGNPSEILDMVNGIRDRRKDVLQDIRKGHVLDRYPQSSISLIHELRMYIEYFLFSHTGPDPERSSNIEKCLQDEESPIIESLFPYLGCIVDSSSDFLTNGDEVRKLAPNTPIIVPAIYIGSAPIGVLEKQTATPEGEAPMPRPFSYRYTVDPLLLNELMFDGVSFLEKTPEIGITYTLSLDSNHEESLLPVRVVGISSEGVPTVEIVTL